MQEIAARLRVLGEEIRLRLLRLLLEESLNVGELTRLLGLAQPTVSKHLAELRRAGVVEKVRRSGYTYYQIAGDLDPWWDALSTGLRERGDEKGDLARLKELSRQRTERSEADRFVVPGRSWVAWSRALRFLLPPLRVADFGCGDGAFTAEIARWARAVYAIDSNPAFLELAKRRLGGYRNVRLICEDMAHVSLNARCVDLVVISQALHCVEEPLVVLQEAYRILSGGARILILELLPHQESWVISELNHRWLGFEPEELRGWLSRAGFRKIDLDPSGRPGLQPFRTLIATGIRPGK